VSEATCKTCPWWVDAMDKNYGNGTCHKNPPRVFDRLDWGAYDRVPVLNAYWPQTRPSDWCGKHPDRNPDHE
jgi:hypothetical protein